MQQPLDLGRIEEASTVSLLYQRYAMGIFTYLRLHVSSREDAEDLLVDTFLAACESPSFEVLSQEQRCTMKSSPGTPRRARPSMCRTAM